MREQKRQPTVEPQPQSQLTSATSPGSEAKRRVSAKVSNHTKRFSVTIQVPEDVAARWPEWFATEKLMGEVFKTAALAAVPARARLVSRLLVLAAIVLVAELFAGGLLLGYLGAGRLQGGPASVPGEPAASAAQSAPTAEPAAGPATAAPASIAPAGGEATPSPAAPTASGPGDPAETAGAGRSSDLSTATTQAAPASTPPAAATADQRPAVAAPAAPAPPTPAAARPAYRVQVGAFRRQINVDEVVLRLRADGYRPVVRWVGDLQVVSVGAFTSRAAAQRLAAELRAKRYDALVVP